MSPIVKLFNIAAFSTKMSLIIKKIHDSNIDTNILDDEIIPDNIQYVTSITQNVPMTVFDELDKLYMGQAN